MAIKELMDFLNKDADPSQRDESISRRNGDGTGPRSENVVFIENAQLETATEQAQRRELLKSGTQWSDQSMGTILVDTGKLQSEDIGRIIEYQRTNGLYFGEAAVEMGLVAQDDILEALSVQFGYTYNKSEDTLSKEMIMAYSPFGEQAEEFRVIRGRLLNDWLGPEQKTLAVVSPAGKEGRSYVAANLALAFSQLGYSTLLIDADLRAPRQHQIFNFSRKVGFSMLLAGRLKMEDLDVLPDQVSNFQHLSVLGAGAIPPNPVELLSKATFSLILRELKKYFDVIIIDTPPATYQADVVSIAAAAGSALMVVRGGCSKMEGTKNLVAILQQAKAKVVGAVLNQY